MKTERPLVLKIVFVCLLSAGYVFFTYTSCFGIGLAAVGSGAIVFFAALAWPGRWPEYLGLKAGKKTALVAAALLLLTAVIAFFLIRSTAAAANIAFGFAPQALIPTLVQAPFQTLNEELILGALLLLSLTRRFPRVPPLAFSIAAAAAFSLLHLLFYSIVLSANRGPLGPLTLLTLFLAGVVRNNFIVFLENIYLAWAVHCGWNLVFLGPFILENMNEPRRFNVFLGSIAALIFISALLFASSVPLFLYRQRKRARPKNPGRRHPPEAG